MCMCVTKRDSSFHTLSFNNFVVKWHNGKYIHIKKNPSLNLRNNFPTINISTICMIENRTCKEVKLISKTDKIGRNPRIIVPCAQDQLTC